MTKQFEDLARAVSRSKSPLEKKNMLSEGIMERLASISLDLI
jgi:hypothetical protein